MVGIRCWIKRSTMPALPRWVKALTRKRATSGKFKEKLTSRCWSNSRTCRSFMIERTSSMVCCGLSLWSPSRRTNWLTLSAGGLPAVMKISDPPNSSNLSANS